MVKSNIRERVANKLQLMKTILDMIENGETVKTDLAKIAMKDIDEIMSWLDNRRYKTKKSS